MLAAVAVLLPTCVAEAQISFDSVLVSGSAGGASFSVDTFTSTLEASSSTGPILSSTSSFASASAELVENQLLIETFTFSESFVNPPPFSSAETFVEIIFHLDSTYSVLFSHSDSALEFNENAETLFSRVDDDEVFELTALPQPDEFVIGPGTYLISSSSDTFVDDLFPSQAFSETFVSVRFVAVPEPSSVALLVLSSAAIAAMRRRIAAQQYVARGAAGRATFGKQ